MHYGEDATHYREDAGHRQSPLSVVGYKSEDHCLHFDYIIKNLIVFADASSGMAIRHGVIKCNPVIFASRRGFAHGFQSRLKKNLNALREREAKYGRNVPLDLLNQVEDHAIASSHSWGK